MTKDHIRKRVNAEEMVYPEADYTTDQLYKFVTDNHLRIASYTEYPKSSPVKIGRISIVNLVPLITPNPKDIGAELKKLDTHFNQLLVELVETIVDADSENTRVVRMWGKCVDKKNLWKVDYVASLYCHGRALGRETKPQAWDFIYENDEFKWPAPHPGRKQITGVKLGPSYESEDVRLLGRSYNKLSDALNSQRDEHKLGNRCRCRQWWRGYL
ncbi:hypothetical protein [Arcanobacterium phocae]|uniref:hypothetical protein n=1 Tax=Arcanobacterium phocae TaxID=131112 RepID=UPI001C0EADCE|nr:hypothetical protein [Arcanobacterium phocae]